MLEATLIGDSPCMEGFRQSLRRVAQTDLTVLLLGESGTGKGVAARLLHQWSTCADGPFVAVNCGALPQTLIDSELFGHVKGAFTGAVARKPGRCERANGGTLFLDEIGDLPLESQTRLLGVLQERNYERVGGSQTHPLDVRIVAATHRDLDQAVAQERFRIDLYYRISGFPLYLPSLRQRREDIPLLADHFLQQFAARHQQPVCTLTPAALTRLQEYDWPGNVRELELTLQHAMVMAEGGAIHPEHIRLAPEEPAPTRAGAVPLLSLAEQERGYLKQVLAHTHGVIHGERGAARILQIKPTTLRSRLQKLGLLPKAARPC
jgi:DNA-binding NtrC family response regulator